MIDKIFGHSMAFDGGYTMTIDEFRKIIADDEYLIERKNPTKEEKLLLLREVNYVCPMCGEPLKLIAHIIIM